MSDTEVPLPSFNEYKAIKFESSAPKLSLKPGSSKQKLRQLMNKTSVVSTHSQSPNQTNQHLSKHGIEATVCETNSPGVSQYSDSSHLFSTKNKSNLSPKLKSKLNPKTSVKSPSYSMNMEVDTSKAKDAMKKSKAKNSSYLGNLNDANSPQTAAHGLFFSDPQSTKENGSIARNYMNFLASQSKPRQHQENKLGKKNNFTEDDHDDDGLNLSLEVKTKPQHSSTMINAKNLSQDSQIVTSLKPDVKEYNPSKGGVDHKKSKSKVGQNGTLGDTKKKLESMKSNFMKSVKSQTIDKKGVKKNNLKVNNATFYNIEKSNTGQLEKIMNEKRRALTPDDLTSKETDRNRMEPKADHPSNKLGVIYNEILARKGSTPGQKEVNVLAKKRPSSNKELKTKSSPKTFKKEKKTTQESPVELKVAKTKLTNVPENIMPRTTKGSSPNIFGGSLTDTVFPSKKNFRRGVEPQDYAHRDQEKNVSTSNEVTLCGTQDTTVNIKGQNRKDVTVEENEDSTDKIKRVLRTKSQGGALIGQILEDLSREKQSKNESRTEKQSITNKKSLGIIKSMDYTEMNRNLLEKEEMSKSELNHNVLSVESENTLELRSPEETHNINDQVTMLSHLLQRSNRLLSTYKDREANWQLERQTLLTKINRLEGKGDAH